MSKNSSEATEKPGTGVLRMALVNCDNLPVQKEKTYFARFLFSISEIISILV